MQIDLYLSNIEKQIDDIKDVIELCKNTDNLNKLETLQYFLKEMESSFNYPNDIRIKFIPELKKNKEFIEAYIFVNSNGDYTIDILVNELDDKMIGKYRNIYQIFSEQNDMFFRFELFDYGKYDFDELEDYDYLKCL